MHDNGWLRIVSVAVITALIGWGATSPARAADDPAAAAVATLEGEVISTEVAAGLHCHDVDHPAIRCFRTADAMAADARRAAQREGSLAALATGYVIVYEHSAYGGASRTLSTDYPNLGSIGWNDRISSFKSIGATGSFREHAPPDGFVYSFGGSSQVTYVGSAYNDRFSAFLID
jgi:hypothetical protein